MPQMTTVKIPFFRYPHLFESQREEILQALTDVMERGAYILQSDLEFFERWLAEYTSARHAIGVANGTDGLNIALRAVGVGPGDEVILPSHTYIATAAAVHFTGAQPVLVDCSDDHLVDPKAMEAAITSKTKALMPVHLNGRTCRMDEICAIAERHGLRVVEDAAQALGSTYQGQSAGTFGDAGEFSFYPAKVLGCFGDGGGLVTNDADVAKKIFLLRDHGRDPNGEVVTWGLNSRLDNLHAAILNVRAKVFQQDIERRRALARQYHTGLQDLEDLTLPPSPDQVGDNFDVFQNYEIEAGNRTALREHLVNAGVHTIIQWAGKAVHQFKDLAVNRDGLPRTNALFERCFLLPMNTSLQDSEIDYIVDIIRSFYGRTV